MEAYVVNLKKDFTYLFHDFSSAGREDPGALDAGMRAPKKQENEVLNSPHDLELTPPVTMNANVSFT